MDIMGHLAVIEYAGVEGEEVWSDDALLALFPNLAHCHEWAYRRLTDDLRRPVERSEKLIQGHIITDWVIHYGPKLTPERHRIGWAYDEAPPIADRLDKFIDRALAAGFAEVDPRRHDTIEHLRRDFGHTTAECALDLGIGAEVVKTPRYEALKASLARMADPQFAGQLVSDIFARLGGYTREGAAVLERTAREYGQWATDVRHPEDFAALTLCTKFDWPYDRPTVDYVLDFLHDVERRLDVSTKDRVVADIVSAIAEPQLLAQAG
jgi:hypothetical protein